MFDRKAAIYELSQNESISEALGIIESELTLAIKNGERKTRVYVDEELAASVRVCLEELGYTIIPGYTYTEDLEYADGYNMMEIWI